MKMSLALMPFSLTEGQSIRPGTVLSSDSIVWERGVRAGTMGGVAACRPDWRESIAAISFTAGGLRRCRRRPRSALGRAHCQAPSSALIARPVEPGS